MFLAPLCNPGVTEDSTQNKSSSFTAMEFAACVLALSRRNLSFVEFAGEFCGLAAVTEMHDAAILHLFRLGASYHHPMDLPDTTGLCWREGIYRCLGSFWSRVGTSSSSSPRAPPSSSPSFPLVPSISALPERPRDAALPERPRDAALPERPRDAALPERPRDAALSERPPVPAPRQHPPVPVPRQCPPGSPRVPGPAIAPRTGAALEASCPVLSLCPVRPPERPPPLPVGWCMVRDAPFGRGE